MDYCQTTSNFNIDAPSSETTPITMSLANYSCLPCATGRCAPQNFAIQRN